MKLKRNISDLFLHRATIYVVQLETLISNSQTIQLFICFQIIANSMFTVYISSVSFYLMQNRDTLWGSCLAGRFL